MNQDKENITLSLKNKDKIMRRIFESPSELKTILSNNGWTIDTDTKDNNLDSASLTLVANNDIPIEKITLYAKIISSAILEDDNKNIMIKTEKSANNVTIKINLNQFNQLRVNHGLDALTIQMPGNAQQP